MNFLSGRHQRRKAFANSRSDVKSKVINLNFLKIGKPSVNSQAGGLQNTVLRPENSSKNSEISEVCIGGHEPNEFKDSAKFPNDSEALESGNASHSFPNRHLSKNVTPSVPENRKSGRNFQSRSVSFRQPSRMSSFKRNSIKAMKSAYTPPGGLEMILASVDESFSLHSNLIHTNDSGDALRSRRGVRNSVLGSSRTENKIRNNSDSTNFRNYGRSGKHASGSIVDSAVVRKFDEKAGNQTSPHRKSSFSPKIDLTEEEIVQWLGGLPIINPEKMLAYFCGNVNSEVMETPRKDKPYTIFSFAKPKQLDQNTLNELQVSVILILNYAFVFIVFAESTFHKKTKKYMRRIHAAKPVTQEKK